MGIEKLIKRIKIGLISLGIGLIGNMLYISVDFSGVRSEKHQRSPVTAQVKGGPGKKYAVLVNGNTGTRNFDFEKRIEFAYNSLRRADFSDENIFVLQSFGKPENYVDGKADYETLKQVFDELKQKVKPEDMVLLYTTNHGGQKYLFLGESELQIDGKLITASDLKEMYRGVNSNYTLGIFTQCFGGGFASSFGNDNSIGISASKENKVSFKEDWDDNEGFVYYIFSAIGGQDPFGKEVNCDNDADGRISIEELFDYPAKNNPLSSPSRFFFKETPQMYWQNANPKDLYIR